jgi:hypothetical protein
LRLRVGSMSWASGLTEKYKQHIPVAIKVKKEFFLKIKK